MSNKPLTQAQSEEFFWAKVQKAAGDGCWLWTALGLTHWIATMCGKDNPIADEDAALLVAAVNNLQALLDCVEALERVRRNQNHGRCADPVYGGCIPRCSFCIAAEALSALEAVK